jgi:arylsulfatase A-like enzyme
MNRANRARGEGAPTSPHGNGSALQTSLESLIALALCLVVILASVAFLQRSSALSRTLADLHGERILAPTPRVRHPGAPGSATTRPELVVVISLDSLRADRLDLYGYARETAPNLTVLAREGVVFRIASAQAAQTLTSHKSMLTAKYPSTLMLEETGADLFELSTLEDPRGYLDDTFSRVEGTLAAGFAAQGYRTGGFTDGGWMSRAAGFAHGFEVFDDSGGGLAHILPRALAWLDSGRDRPAFLFLHANDLHAPYSTREPFDSAFCADHAAHLPLQDEYGEGVLAPADLAAVSAHYDAGVLSADDHLGRFLEALQARGLHEPALIVVTSDHGESLGERGVVGHGGLALEQLLVPLVLKFPRTWNVVPQTIEEPVELVDLLPTLFALSAVPAPAGIDGRSLLPTLFRGVHGRDYLVAETAFDEAPGHGASAAKRTLLRPGRWQVIHEVARSRADFYSLEGDPAGLEPLPIAAHEFAPLLELLLARGRPDPRGAAPFDDEPVTFGAELERELDALGYAAAAAAGPGDAHDLR